MHCRINIRAEDNKIKKSIATYINIPNYVICDENVS